MDWLPWLEFIIGVLFLIAVLNALERIHAALRAQAEAIEGLRAALVQPPKSETAEEYLHHHDVLTRLDDVIKAIGKFRKEVERVLLGIGSVTQDIRDELKMLRTLKGF